MATTSTAERPTTKRHDAVAKIDAAVLRDAKIAAAYKEMSLAEYLTETMRVASAKDIQEEHDKRTKPRPARR